MRETEAALPLGVCRSRTEEGAGLKAWHSLGSQVLHSYFILFYFF